MSKLKPISFDDYIWYCYKKQKKGKLNPNTQYFETVFNRNPIVPEGLWSKILLRHFDNYYS